MRIIPKILIPLALPVIFSLLCATPAEAYIGPGAGFAFVSSFFVLIASIIAAVLILLTAPVRLLFRLVRRKRLSKSAAGRVIILGLDGLDPKLAAEMMDAGELPNFKSLAESGSFSPLKTTCPAMSPVAWSSFMTGVTPARHNIFDFLTPDRKTYLPVLSSSDVRPGGRAIKIGPFRFPLGKPVLINKRKAKPFWRILGENGIYSCVLRVPITFPPEPFRGHLLSGMCVPDLLGTQGTFTYYTSAGHETRDCEGGVRIRVAPAGGKVESEIRGPDGGGAGRSAVPFRIAWRPGSDEALLFVNNRKIRLKAGKYSDWVQLKFRVAPGIGVYGICRFYLKSLDPEFGLYVSPINIDPGRPALPVSHPFIYSMLLSKALGPYATLGLAEDTWALNERVLDEDAFLEQCWKNHDEREKMFFYALSRTRRGACVCVFDTTDRIQHMFWRYRESAKNGAGSEEKYSGTIRGLYMRMDDLLGRVRVKMKKDDVLIVMSDHGFGSFRRGVDLNAWLARQGWLKPRPDAAGDKWLSGVDWSQTRAYALGLAGIYLNIKGREKNGIVEPADAEPLREQIAAALLGLKDGKTGEVAIRNVYNLRKIQSGPYLENAPDLVAGYNDGYRVSWDCAVGKIGGAVFEDNTRSWSGDHCIDPELVPGCFFSSVKINGRTPEMIDIAPSVLSLFGVAPPANIEGKPLFIRQGSL